MNKNASLRLSDKDIEILETIKKAYNISNTSELLRVLLKKEYHALMAYEGLYNLSEKQIINLGLYTNCSTKNRRKENEMHKSIM